MLIPGVPLSLDGPKNHHRVLHALGNHVLDILHVLGVVSRFEEKGRVVSSGQSVGNFGSGRAASA